MLDYITYKFFAFIDWVKDLYPNWKKKREAKKQDPFIYK
tara:strand:+ start:460 stop:576 length:117 start_codon:yes stop_codon:yes gene_type:complete